MERLILLLAVLWVGPAFAAPPTCMGLTATLWGGPGDNILIGGAGKDVIAGLGGNDEIRGRDANDTMCGGYGNDYINGGPGAGDRGRGGPGYDTCVDIDQGTVAYDCEKEPS